jgi:hypothetical protein
MVAGSYCAYTIINEDADPVCACVFNNVPADMEQTSFPDRHKEIMQQTEWQYIATTSLQYHFCYDGYQSNQYPQLNILYTSSSIGSIFHPPSFS